MTSLAGVRTDLPGTLQLSLYAAALALLYFIATSVYDVFFGPLSKFPGPKLWAFTYIPRLTHQAFGTECYAAERLHKQYGPVVRVGPRELSYASGGQAWKDIYGHRKKGEAQPSKDKVFYHSPAEPVPSILGANDANHARFRRIFSPAFAEKALKDQEPMLQRWMGFLQMKLSDHANGVDKLDFQKIFVCCSFDLTGELTFSESLNMLHDTKYSAWVDSIFEGIKVATVLRSFRQWHASTRHLIDDVLAKTKGARQQMEEHMRYTNERVDRRLQRQPERPDLWSRVLAKQDEEGGMSMDEQYSNASLLMMAGAETTAMALASTLYFLLRNPRCLQKVTEEIRGAFTDLSEVTLDKAARLEYLNATLQESMRVHPANAITLLRTVPAGGLTICDEYVPENVNVGINHYANSRQETHFKHANEFHPERWLGAEEFKHDHLDASEPFMVGPRNCVGKNLAWHEMRFLMIGVLHDFDLKLCEESAQWEDQRMWTFWEKKALMVTLTPVKA